MTEIFLTCARALGVASAWVYCVVAATAWAAPPAAVPAVDSDLRALVTAMKSSPKGPFEAVRWFCADGAVLPPRAGACVARGGGIQHGVLSASARDLRDQGFLIGTVLASLDVARFVGDAPDLVALQHLVLERFLIRWDDGWIFRGARSYRGALQVEDEEAASERILLALLADPGWLDTRLFFPLREVARSLPLPRQVDVASRMRIQAAELGDADPGFATLRARIHSFPEPGDSGRVREYARTRTDGAAYQTLAKTIDEFFATRTAAAALGPLIPKIGGALGAALRAELGALSSTEAGVRLAASGRALEAIRRAFGEEARSASRLAALRASLALEVEAFSAGQAFLATSLDRRSRRDRLEALPPLAASLYGAGLLSGRQVDMLRDAVSQLAEAHGDEGGDGPSLGVWRTELGFLARAPEWSRRWLMFHFGPALAQFAQLDTEAALYEPDRLRGSPLLAYTALLDELVRDAQQLSGATDRVFGEAVGVGLRGLNAGIARGVLREATHDEEVAALPSDSVALLPETTAHLPPVAAILTLGEGSSLSHIQLLARNLGIPNAVVSLEMAQRLRARLGHDVEVVVSRGGLVQIERVDESTAPAERASPDPGHAIHVDESRLRMERAGLIPLDQISAEDSGRLCGPKAANLGELRKHFGATVPDGFVLPFGVYRKVLNRPIEPGGPAAFDWLKARYRELEGLSGAERSAETERVLTRMREWIAAQEPSRALHDAIEAQLARLGGGGVFVRSDTNVEDLPGFSGAGLNLTVANVVGADAVLAAVARVWASPFSSRAFAWRQAHMAQPELVFPSILVQQAFPAEKSGVMVTVDIDSGDPDVLSVAVGEGVGGAVDGQASESLRIDLASGRVRQTAAATAPFASELDPNGGIRRRAASGAESLLLPGEIDQLIALRGRIKTLPGWKTTPSEDQAADVEFAFRDGRLALLQLRPLAESRSARVNERLRAVDAAWGATADRRVNLDERPGGALSGGNRSRDESPGKGPT